MKSVETQPVLREEGFLLETIQRQIAKLQMRIPQCCLSVKGFVGKWTFRQNPPVLRTPSDVEALTGCFGSRFPFYHFCYLRGESEFNRTVQMLNWEWDQEECGNGVLQFDPHEFASLFKNKTLLYIGDSIIHEQFMELKCHLENLINHTVEAAKSFLETLAKDEFHLTNGARIVFVRNDLLVHPQTFELQLDPSEGLETSNVWAPLAYEASVIVFNNIPHTKSIDEAKLASEKVLNFFSSLPQDRERIFVFRTPVPGNPGCELIRKPYEHTNLSMPYQWNLFAAYQNVWRQAILSLNNTNPKLYSQFLILEVEAHSFSRGDTHSHPPVDCLHFCVPGPIHHWNVLLFAWLKCLSDTDLTPASLRNLKNLL